MTNDLPRMTSEPNPFWKKNAENVVGESITIIEDVAKQIIVMTTLLEGLYFHAITFSDLRGTLSGGIVLVYLAPIALWLISLFFALWTLTPRDYRVNINSSRDSKETFEKLVSDKHIRLIFAESILITSFLSLLIAVYYYLTSKPPA
ncbi:MAG: hypothetical protein WCP70_15040 [Methanothrix sp.]